MKSHVYVVDDDASVRTGMTRLLKAAGYAITSFDSAGAFLGALPDLEADCLLLDVQMDGRDGMELHGILARDCPSLPVVFLTGHGDIPMSVRAMKRGAEDFLTKPVDEKVLLGAIERAIEAGRKRRGEARERGDFESRLAQLTPRELEVLRCLLTGALNKQVGAHLGITEKTVKVHRAHLLEKMNTPSLTELARQCEHIGVEPIEL